MQAHQGRPAVRLPDQQRDVIVGALGRTEGDDLRIFCPVDRQARARCKRQPPGILVRIDIGRGDRDFRITPVDEEGGQQARDPRQAKRRRSRLRMGNRKAAPWPFQRRGEIEAGIREGGGARKVEPGCALDQDRQVGIGCIALVGELQRLRASGRDKDRRSAVRIEFGQPPRVTRLDRQQRQPVDRDRPPPAQRVDCPRGGAGTWRGRMCQKANSVMIGTWSEGFSQLRQASNTVCATAWRATSPVAHIWSSRRPRSFFVQSGER